MPKCGPVAGSKAQRIEALMQTEMSNVEIARHVGTTAKYVGWIRWTVVHRESRRTYERDRKRQKPEKSRHYTRSYERAKRAGLSLAKCRAAGREASSRV